MNKNELINILIDELTYAHRNDDDICDYLMCEDSWCSINCGMNPCPDVKCIKEYIRRKYETTKI